MFLHGPHFRGDTKVTDRSIETPCENLVPLIEAVDDFVVYAGKQARLTRSSVKARHIWTSKRK